MDQKINMIGSTEWTQSDHRQIKFISRTDKNLRYTIILQYINTY